MKDADWVRRELTAAKKEVASWPDWKRWGAEIETKDTAQPAVAIETPSIDKK